MIAINNLTKKMDFGRAEELLRFALSDHPLVDVTLNVTESDKTLDRLSAPGYELQALIYPTVLPHSYNLIVRTRPDTSLEVLMFHESVHLCQFESGKLGVDMKSGKYTWNGEEYPADFPYLSRPWEKEAIKGQAALSKEWKAIKKSVCRVRKRLFGKNAK